MSIVTKPGALVLSLLGPVYAITAHCEIYMTEQKAVSLIFPGQEMSRFKLAITDDQADKIEKLSDDAVKNKKFSFYKAKTGKDIVVIDQALGKHEMITYAIGITADGKVKAIEIIEYKESYGHQVRRDEWRAQFVGKDKTSTLKLDEDIKNISGATLSSAHITAGVKRILQTYDIVKSKI